MRYTARCRGLLSRSRSGFMTVLALLHAASPATFAARPLLVVALLEAAAASPAPRRILQSERARMFAIGSSVGNFARPSPSGLVKPAGGRVAANTPGWGP